MDKLYDLVFLLSECLYNTCSGEIVVGLGGNGFLGTVSFAGKIPESGAELDCHEDQKRKEYACYECHLPVQPVHDGKRDDDRYSVNEYHRDSVYEEFPYSFGITQDSCHQTAGLFVYEEVKGKPAHRIEDIGLDIPDSVGCDLRHAEYLEIV